MVKFVANKEMLVPAEKLGWYLQANNVSTRDDIRNHEHEIAFV